jgi:leader peptidase (prepilin peptidase)/N-methyltransferase
MVMHAIWIVFLLALGACVGSFLNVVIYRLPRGESLSFPGSHCPSCGQPIRWYDNIPILSWLRLKARCRHCGVSISPRYVIIEAVTALLVAGLYVAYFVIHLRSGAGRFEDAWPMFAAHAALLCGLLASSAVDIERWIIPRSVCIFLVVVGLASAAYRPHPFLPKVSAGAAAVTVGACVGLAISALAQWLGYLEPSFIDASDKPAGEPPDVPASKKKASKANSKAKGAKGKNKGGAKAKAHKKSKAQPATAVAYTADHGVNPRGEILKELLYVLPAVALGAVAWALVSQWPGWGAAWQQVARSDAPPGSAAYHINSFLSAVFGLLIGGATIWAARIFGTLGFGKEAMGLGDADLMAAVGAVTGWVVPVIAFFLAPFFGLLWAVYLWLGRNQRELPYGPWLALASGVVMVAYDPLAELLSPYAQAFSSGG